MENARSRRFLQEHFIFNVGAFRILRFVLFQMRWQQDRTFVRLVFFCKLGRNRDERFGVAGTKLGGTGCICLLGLGGIGQVFD